MTHLRPRVMCRRGGDADAGLAQAAEPDRGAAPGDLTPSSS
ncbi:MAG: hypothetical protein M5U28_24655 [Sandaracinaceae bacterium]|nr:hypothetical protein [Sandaracinaceae bacterium]